MRLPVCVVAAGILVTAAVLPGPVVLRAQSGPAATATSHLTAEAMETFLLKTRIGSMRSAGGGVTDSRRATLTDGVLTHDAQIQATGSCGSSITRGRSGPLVS